MDHLLRVHATPKSMPNGRMKSAQPPSNAGCVMAPCNLFCSFRRSQVESVVLFQKPDSPGRKSQAVMPKILTPISPSRPATRWQEPPRELQSGVPWECNRVGRGGSPVPSGLAGPADARTETSWPCPPPCCWPGSVTTSAEPLHATTCITTQSHTHTHSQRTYI